MLETKVTLLLFAARFSLTSLTCASLRELRIASSFSCSWLSVAKITLSRGAKINCWAKEDPG
jgi:hypothetical protein